MCDWKKCVVVRSSKDSIVCEDFVGSRYCVYCVDCEDCVVDQDSILIVMIITWEYGTVLIVETLCR